jgi:biotin carboxyl carrier protein
VTVDGARIDAHVVEVEGTPVRLVTVGEPVTARQGVVVVEAMKMENELRSPRDGRIKDVPAREGQAVEANQTLVTVE